MVTGASRGIGRAVALALCDQHDLLLVARSGPALEEVASECSERGAEVTIRSADLGTAEGRSHLVESLKQERVAPLVLINNAGIAPSAPLWRTDDETWERVMAINVTAPFELIRALSPTMKSQGWGRIVNVASTSALKGYRYTAAYSASKGALVALTRAVAAELAGTGVTVNAVCPGFTETDISATAIQNIADATGRSLDEARRSLEKFSPQGRLVRPDEVAAMVAYLVGSKAESVHGQALCIDGGETA